MDTLPRSLPVLDSNGQKASPSRVWKRLDPRPADAKRFSEAALDTILSENVDVLAEALREAGVIAEDSTLKFLGQQIDRIDLLMAEVKDGGEHELRRLVLVEDKLLRNPEARRAVLAQLLEYAQTAQEQWSVGPEELASQMPDHRAWFMANADALQYTLRRADILLIIAGDGIDPGLQKLARRFAAQDNPLSLMELALVSVGLFTLDNQLLLVPHVVSAVERGQREVTIRVKVEDEEGRPLKATVERDLTIDENTSVRRRVDRDSFLASCTPVSRPLFALLLDEAARHGHHIYWGISGFSIAAYSADRSLRWTFLYGFPEDVFRFYFQQGAPWSAEAEAPGIRAELLALGIFRESGKYTLEVNVDTANLARAREAAHLAFSSVARVMARRAQT